MPASNGDVFASSWMGLHWSAWVSLDNATRAYRGGSPPTPGLYRIRTNRSAGLIYVGETGKGIRNRLQMLQAAIRYASPGSVGRPPHVAGACVAAHIRGGHSVEVSWVVAPELDARERKGLECDLIAAHRRQLGSSPDCQFAGVFAEEASETA
jgi:hypothetical protein